jgi:hypothetical protein
MKKALDKLPILCYDNKRGKIDQRQQVRKRNVDQPAEAT